MIARPGRAWTRQTNTLRSAPKERTNVYQFRTARWAFRVSWGVYSRPFRAWLTPTSPLDLKTYINKTNPAGFRPPGSCFVTILSLSLCCSDRLFRRFDSMLLAGGEELLSVNWHIARRFDAEADLAAIDVHNGNADIIADKNLLSQFSTEDEHFATLRCARSECPSRGKTTPRSVCQAGGKVGNRLPDWSCVAPAPFFPHTPHAWPTRMGIAQPQRTLRLHGFCAIGQSATQFPDVHNRYVQTNPQNRFNNLSGRRRGRFQPLRRPNKNFADCYAAVCIAPPGRGSPG